MGHAIDMALLASRPTRSDVNVKMVCTRDTCRGILGKALVPLRPAEDD